MARIPQDVTDAELAVLQVLWDQGPATIVRHQLGRDPLYDPGRIVGCDCESVAAVGDLGRRLQPAASQ